MGGEMKIISFINEYQIIRKILEYLRLWVQKPSREPPGRDSSPEHNELTYELFYIISHTLKKANSYHPSNKTTQAPVAQKDRATVF